jgi:hypothetical protein
VGQHRAGRFARRLRALVTGRRSQQPVPGVERDPLPLGCPAVHLARLHPAVAVQRFFQDLPVSRAAVDDDGVGREALHGPPHLHAVAPRAELEELPRRVSRPVHRREQARLGEQPVERVGRPFGAPPQQGVEDGQGGLMELLGLYDGLNGGREVALLGRRTVARRDDQDPPSSRTFHPRSRV